MDYDDVEALRQSSAAWRLLRADHAVLIVSFLGRVYVDDNTGPLLFTDLSDRLDDTLYALNERLGAGTFPRRARDYLDDWAAEGSGWLRKYYPAGSSEAHLDATPALGRAVAWVRTLPQRGFVGTESRLTTALDLLRQIAFGAETDVEARLRELYRRRAELDDDIARLRTGEVAVMDPSAIRDRYQQFVATALSLLGDFREVEERFRGLDRAVRERVATWDGAKAGLLDDVLGARDAIGESDEGRSFQAFYDFLMARSRQEEFSSLLAVVHSLAEINEADPRVRQVHFDWLAAGNRTQATVRLLSEQLRRFLDDRAWLENRRVMDILRSIESSAVAVRHHPGGAPSTDLDELAPTVTLPFERPLYTPHRPLELDTEPAPVGEEQLDVAALFDQTYVDASRLSAQVRRSLAQRGHVGLSEVLRDEPLEHGLAELVGYFALDDTAFEAVIDETTRDDVRWTDPDGRRRLAHVPRLTFLRRTPREVSAP